MRREFGIIAREPCISLNPVTKTRSCSGQYSLSLQSKCRLVHWADTLLKLTPLYCVSLNLQMRRAISNTSEISIQMSLVLTLVLTHPCQSTRIQYLLVWQHCSQAEMGTTYLALMEVNQHLSYLHIIYLLWVIQGTVFALKHRSLKFFLILLHLLAVKVKNIDKEETLPQFLYQLHQDVYTFFCNYISRKSSSAVNSKELGTTEMVGYKIRAPLQTWLYCPT